MFSTFAIDVFNLLKIIIFFRNKLIKQIMLFIKTAMEL